MTDDSATRSRLMVAFVTLCLRRAATISPTSRAVISESRLPATNERSALAIRKSAASCGRRETPSPSRPKPPRHLHNGAQPRRDRHQLRLVLCLPRDAALQALDYLYGATSGRAFL